MNVAKFFADGFKRIYSGKDALVRNIVLFILAGIISCVSTRFDLITSAVQGVSAPDMLGNFGFLLGTLIIGIYLCGYCFNFMHNSYDENEDNILPAINLTPFKTFFNVLPLLFVWGIYLVVLTIISIAAKGVSPILGAVVFIFIALLSAFMQYIYVIYAKDFRKKGLFNPVLPFKCARYSLGEYVLSALLIVASYLVVFLAVVALIIILTLFGSNFVTISYVTGILGGYVALILQLVFSYMLVHVYLEKVRPNSVVAEE